MNQRWAGPACYFALGLGLMWAARSPVFVREDALQVPNFCGWLSTAPASRLLLTRAVGEDGAYYRPLENLFLGAMARTAGCADARPYRAAAGLIWLLCAASLVPILVRAGVASNAAWAAAALLMAHPYNSWYFVSPILIAGPLLIPAAIGAWFAYEAAERRSGGAVAAAAAAACVYAGCLSRENGVIIPVGMAVAAVAFKRPLSRSACVVLASAFVSAGLYLLQRRWVLAHDPPVQMPALDWTILPRVGVAYSSYLWIWLAGVFRSYGGLIPADRAAAHFAAWAAAAAGVVGLSSSRRDALAWTALFLVCSSEIAVSALLNGEIVPVRATGSIAFVLGLSAWAMSGRRTPQIRAAFAACLLAGVFWTAKSFRHAYASRDGDYFLEVHSNPPYSWKIEAERAASWLKRGEPDKAYAAAQASERLRPGWLARVLRASIEAVSIRPGGLEEVRVLARTGRGEPSAHLGYLNLGAAFGRNGAWPEAAGCFRLAAELAPDFSRAWSQWSWAEIGARNWAGAAALARKAVELNPGDLDGRQNLAYALLWLRDWAGAADAYRALYAAAPLHPATKIFWAFAEENAGAPEKAWDILAAAPGDPYAAAYLDLLGRKLGRRPPAAADPRMAAALLASFPPVR